MVCRTCLSYLEGSLLGSKLRNWLSYTVILPFNIKPMQLKKYVTNKLTILYTAVQSCRLSRSYTLPSLMWRCWKYFNRYFAYYKVTGIGKNFVQFHYKDPGGKSATCDIYKQAFVSLLSPLVFVKLVNKTSLNIHDDNLELSLPLQESRENGKPWCNNDD